MKKSIALVASLLVLASLLLYGVETKPRDMPVGVEPEMWVPVADNFGIVLSDENARSNKDPRGLMGSGVRGTPMVKIDGAWCVLYVTSPTTLVPLNQ